MTETRPPAGKSAPARQARRTGGEEPPVSPAKARTLGLAAAASLRFQHFTWRRETRDVARLFALFDERPIMVVFWHGKFFPLFSLLEGRSVVIFSSESPRGAVIGDVARRFGHVNAMLPHFGGPRSVVLMRRALEGGRSGALAVDGPLGPARVVKPGAVELAARLGMPLVPVSTAASRFRVMEDRWDRRELPRLFSRVSLAIGEPVEVARDAGAEALADARRRLRVSLDAAGERAEALAAGRAPAARGAD